MTLDGLSMKAYLINQKKVGFTLFPFLCESTVSQAYQTLPRD